MRFDASVDIAEAYDRWFEARWGRYAFQVEAAALLAAAGPLSGLRVLDAGCGSGRFTVELLRSGARTQGIDTDPAMLAVARRKRIDALALADAAQLPFAAASFDVAFAVTLCEFVRSVDQVFAELARVTKPGGRFVVGSLSTRSPWGLLSRKRLRRPPWTLARFLTRQELIELGSRYGAASVTSALYAWESLPALARTGPVVEWLGRLVPGLGAFQVLVVQLPSQAGSRR